MKFVVFNVVDIRTYLNGARLGKPFAESEDTNAIGLGTIELVIKGYISLHQVLSMRSINLEIWKRTLVASPSDPMFSSPPLLASSML